MSQKVVYRYLQTKALVPFEEMGYELPTLTDFLKQNKMFQPRLSRELISLIDEQEKTESFALVRKLLVAFLNGWKLEHLHVLLAKRSKSQAG